jgi:hypothetical protein
MKENTRSSVKKNKAINKLMQNKKAGRCAYKPAWAYTDLLLAYKSNPFGKMVSNWCLYKKCNMAYKHEAQTNHNGVQHTLAYM